MDKKEDTHRRVAQKEQLIEDMNDARLLSMATARMEGFDASKLISQADIEAEFGFTAESIREIGEIEFENRSLLNATEAINTDGVTVDQLRNELQAGYEDMKAGNVQDASAAFAKFREGQR